MNQPSKNNNKEYQPPSHISTYNAGEDSNRLASAARYFGLRNARSPLRPIREQQIINPVGSHNEVIDNDSSQSNDNNSTDRILGSHRNQHVDSQSILKFGSTVWNNVGLIFSDSTLEAARMHSVGVFAAGEYVANDGTLHLKSIVRRMKKKKIHVVPLGDMFKPLSEEEQGTIVGKKLEIEGEEEIVEYEDVVVETVSGGSIAAAIFGIIKGMVGPAILYLPRGFSMSGYGVAIPAMICATASYLYCATRLLQCWKVENDRMIERMEQIRFLLDPEATSNNKQSTGGRYSYGSLAMKEGDIITSQQQSTMAPQWQGKLLTYPELARRAFGNFACLISGGIAGMQFGVCLTYLIFVPQNIFELIRNIFGIIVPKEVILICMLMIEIPLCWIRDIRKLTPMNILATIMIAFGLLSVLFIALVNTGHFDQIDGTETLLQKVSELPPVKDTWALFVGTSFFCFEGSITLLVPLQEAVYGQKDRSRFPSVNTSVVSSIVFFYIIFATICWASFGDSVQTALTASLPKGILSSLVQFAYSIAVIFTFPLQAFPALEVVCHTADTRTGKEKDAMILKRNITSTVIVCVLGVIAIMANNYLGNVVSLLGSLVGIPIALIYPPLMHNRLVKNSSRATKIMNICLSGVGLFAAGAASYTTIKSWNEGAEG